MTVVRILGSLVLGLLALGGLLSLPDTLRYVDGSDVSIAAATIDIAIPLGLGFLAYKVWPKRRTPGTGSPGTTFAAVTSSWGMSRGFMGALTETMQSQCGLGLLVWLEDGSFEFQTDDGGRWSFSSGDVTSWRVEADRGWIAKIPGLDAELGWALVLTAGPGMMNPDFWLQPSNKDRWIARLAETGITESDRARRTEGG